MSPVLSILICILSNRPRKYHHLCRPRSIFLGSLDLHHATCRLTHPEQGAEAPSMKRSKASSASPMRLRPEGERSRHDSGVTSSAEAGHGHPDAGDSYIPADIWGHVKANTTPVPICLPPCLLYTLPLYPPLSTFALVCPSQRVPRVSKPNPLWNMTHIARWL